MIRKAPWILAASVILAAIAGGLCVSWHDSGIMATKDGIIASKDEQIKFFDQLEPSHAGTAT